MVAAAWTWRVLLIAFAIVAAGYVGGKLLLVVLPVVVEKGSRKAGELLRPLGISQAEVDKAIDDGVKSLEGSGGKLTGGAVSGALAALNVLAAILLTLVLTFFFVKDGRRPWSWITGLFGGHRRARVMQPLLVGRQIELHPVVVLLALTAGGVVAGSSGRSLRCRLLRWRGLSLRSCGRGELSWGSAA